MSTLYDFLNADGTEVEEQRLIKAPAATTGDVLTVNADKTVSPAPGGSQPVSCLLAMDGALNIRTASQFPIVWDALYDNAKDFNTLASIPAGLGLTFLFDGTSANITTTAAGIWAFAYQVNRAADATWIGNLVTSGLGRNFQLYGATTDASTVVTDVLALPSGTTIAPTINVETQATAGTYTASAYLSIVRLG